MNKKLFMFLVLVLMNVFVANAALNYFDSAEFVEETNQFVFTESPKSLDFASVDCENITEAYKDASEFKGVASDAQRNYLWGDKVIEKTNSKEVSPTDDFFVEILNTLSTQTGKEEEDQKLLACFNSDKSANIRKEFWINYSDFLNVNAKKISAVEKIENDYFITTVAPCKNRFGLKNLYLKGMMIDDEGRIIISAGELKKGNPDYEGTDLRLCGYYLDNTLTTIEATTTEPGTVDLEKMVALKPDLKFQEMVFEGNPINPVKLTWKGNEYTSNENLFVSFENTETGINTNKIKLGSFYSSGPGVAGGMSNIPIQVKNANGDEFEIKGSAFFDSANKKFELTEGSSLKIFNNDKTGFVSVAADKTLPGERYGVVLPDGSFDKTIRQGVNGIKYEEKIFEEKDGTKHYYLDFKTVPLKDGYELKINAQNYRVIGDFDASQKMLSETKFGKKITFINSNELGEIGKYSNGFIFDYKPGEFPAVYTSNLSSVNKYTGLKNVNHGGLAIFDLNEEYTSANFPYYSTSVTGYSFIGTFDEAMKSKMINEKGVKFVDPNLRFGDCLILYTFFRDEKGIFGFRIDETKQKNCNNLVAHVQKSQLPQTTN